MPKLPVIGPIWDYLISPSYPRTAVSITETELSLVTLRRVRREFEPQHLAVVRLPAGLIRADFNEPNILDEEALGLEFEKLAAQAGIKRLKRLTAALPEGSARSLVMSLDGVPGGRQELVQMLEWKIERTIGCSTGEARLSYSRLHTGKQESHWLVTVTHKAVIEQYEEFFRRLGWQIGLFLPAHLAEAQWLLRSGGEGDQALISLNPRGFVAVITRGDSPLLIREVECSKPEIEDEFHRLMLYYRDRLATPNEPLSMKRLLVLGTPEEQEMLRRAASESLETPVASLNLAQLGLRIDPPAPLTKLAAAAGLSTFGWTN